MYKEEIVPVLTKNELSVISASKIIPVIGEFRLTLCKGVIEFPERG
jgi:hypothetical protein